MEKSQTGKPSQAILFCTVAAVFYGNLDFVGHPAGHSFATDRVFTVSDSIENDGNDPDSLPHSSDGCFVGFPHI